MPLTIYDQIAVELCFCFVVVLLQHYLKVYVPTPLFSGLMYGEANQDSIKKKLGPGPRATTKFTEILC